jgi:Carboxypeptidase regulatory-like domain
MMRRHADIVLRFWLPAAMAGIILLAPLAAGQKHDSSPRSVSGRVVNAEDQPLAKAVVYLKDIKTLAIRSYITQEDGSFHFSGLGLNVDYEIYADFQGARSNVKTLSAFDEHKQTMFTLKVRSAK